MSIGVSKEEFWESCPCDLWCYEDAHKLQMKEKNSLLYLQGLYNYRAVSAAVDNCLKGKKSKATYLEEPIRIFPLTKEEQEKEEEKELNKFVAFANGMIANSKK